MENTEFTEVFNRFFSVIFVVSVVKKPLRNTFLGRWQLALNIKQKSHATSVTFLFAFDRQMEW